MKKKPKNPKCPKCKTEMRLHFGWSRSAWICPNCPYIRPNPKGSLGYEE